MANFYVQWHLTDRCPGKCRHCYQDSRISPELPSETINNVLRDMKCQLDKKSLGLAVSFSGGDPLLYPEVRQVLAHTLTLTPNVNILGTPFLVDDDIASFLARIGIRYYQMSLDGLKVSHNYIRGEGVFEKTVSSIEVLKKHGIKTSIMFTANKWNQHDLIPLMDFCAKMGVSNFAFDSMIPIGEGSKISRQMLSAREYRTLLRDYFDKALSLQGGLTTFTQKGSLWALFHSERENSKELQEMGHYQNDRLIYSGCSAGWGQIAVLPNGEVLACRRLPSLVLGRFPEQSFSDVLISGSSSALMNLDKYMKCGDCELIFICRGCPARVQVSGDYFSPDPLCWKESNHVSS